MTFKDFGFITGKDYDDSFQWLSTNAKPSLICLEALNSALHSASKANE
jgi:hypothetical protein